MEKRKLVVISFDALIYEDIEYLSKKPNFKYALENGSLIKRMKGIYPTLTYPCHVTMATGCYPDKHGVTKNTYDETVENPSWLFEHKNVRCEDIFDAAKRAGLTTAAVGWPVTGNHPSVDYLVNECWPESGAPIERYAEKYVEQGTPRWLLDEAVTPRLSMRYGRKQPQSSYFLTEVSADIIRKYKPDLLMLHMANVDHFRHRTGVFSEQVTASLDDVDNMLGMLFDAARDAGTFENTNYVMTADHGQMNCTRRVYLNRIFADSGLIETDGERNVTSWRAWCYTVGMSAQIYLSDKSDRNLYNEVYGLLTKLRDEGVWGIGEVYTKEEAQKMRLDGDFTFIVEGDGFTELAASVKNGVCRITPPLTSGHIFGDHGYHPDKGPRPPFIAFGPSVKKGVTTEGAHLVDGAPTYAKILGVTLPFADGKAVDEILIENNL